MLDPCSVCVSAYATCDQCWFGYIGKREAHERFKDVLLKYDDDHNTFYWRWAEQYIRLNPDWRSKLEYKEENANA